DTTSAAPTINLRVDGPVQAIISDEKGGAFVAGAFGHAGGLAQGQVMHLFADGSLDPDFGVSANSTVRAMALHGPNGLIIGGDFAVVNGMPRRGLAAVALVRGATLQWTPPAAL